MKNRIVIAAIAGILGLAACDPIDRPYVPTDPAPVAPAETVPPPETLPVPSNNLFEYFGDNGCYVASAAAAVTAGYQFASAGTFGTWTEGTPGAQVALGGPANGGFLGYSMDATSPIYGPDVACGVPSH